MKMNKSVLEKAKAFLCFDVFPGLSIQLVAMREAVSYYYPPFERSTIIVYYGIGISDFSTPLFHLFHEAGHHANFLRKKNENDVDAFHHALDNPTGSIRIEFEKQAWEEGRRLLMQFIEKEPMESALIESYDVYARKSINTYGENQGDIDELL